MPKLHYTEEEREFWQRIQDCFDADARAKGVDPREHMIVFDLDDKDRAYLTTDDNSLAIEQMKNVGKQLSEAAAKRYEDILVDAVSTQLPDNT